MRLLATRTHDAVAFVMIAFALTLGQQALERHGIRTMPATISKSNGPAPFDGPETTGSIPAAPLPSVSGPDRAQVPPEVMEPESDPSENYPAPAAYGWRQWVSEVLTVETLFKSLLVAIIAVVLKELFARPLSRLRVGTRAVRNRAATAMRKWQVTPTKKEAQKGPPA